MTDTTEHAPHTFEWMQDTRDKVLKALEGVNWLKWIFFAIVAMLGWTMLEVYGQGADIAEIKSVMQAIQEQLNK